jgi:hypothetical protein
MAGKNAVAIVNGTAVAKPDPPPPFRLTEVPLILFEEVSAKLGLGGETGVPACRCRNLKPDHAMTGFPGRITVRTWGECSRSFNLWDRPRSPDDDETGFEPVKLLEITAWPSDAGIWTMGRGTLRMDAIKADFSCGGLYLEHPAATLVALCIMRAAQLARDPSCQRKKFWDRSTADEGLEDDGDE